MLGPSLTVVLLLGHASLWSICSAATLPREWQTDDKFQFIRNHFCNSTNGTSASQDMCRDMRQHNEKSICSVICSESRGQSEQMSNRRCYNSTGKLTLSTAPWDVCETGQYLHCYYTDTIVCGNNGNNGSCIYVNTTSIQPVCIYRDSTSMFQPPVIITSTTRKTTTTTNDDSTATPQEISTGRVDNLDGTTTAARRGGPRARQPNVVSIVLGVILGVVLLAVVLVACLCRRSKLLANKASSKEQMDFKESVCNGRVNLAEPTGTSDHTHEDNWRLPDGPWTGEPAETDEDMTMSNQDESEVAPQQNYQPLTAAPQLHNYTPLQIATEAAEDTGEASNEYEPSLTNTGAQESHHYSTLNQTPEADTQHAYSEVVPVSGQQSKDPGTTASAYDHLVKQTGGMTGTNISHGTVSEYDHPRNMSANKANEGVPGRSQKPLLTSAYASVSVI